jgi:hypothetical protein
MKTEAKNIIIYKFFLSLFLDGGLCMMSYSSFIHTQTIGGHNTRINDRKTLSVQQHFFLAATAIKKNTFIISITA